MTRVRQVAMWAGLAGLAWTFGSSARGQVDSSSGTTTWAVPEVVVRAAAPRVWRLTRGASTVYVLGSVEPLPAHIVWNSFQLERIMSGANRLIVPPYSAVGVFGGLQALGASRLPGDRTLDAELPPDLTARLHAVLAKLGRDPESLQRDKPGWAALTLERDLRSSSLVSDAEPMATLRKLARDKHVPMIESGHYNATPMLKELADLPDPQGLAALTLAISSTEHQMEHSVEIGHAWASGNLRDLSAAEGPSARMSDLLKKTSSGETMSGRAEDDEVRAVDAALALPGVSVTAMDIHQFAKKGGTIDRLRAEGVEVVEPS